MISPSCRCCALKYFWLRPTTARITNSDSGRINTVMPVISGLMVSIIYSTPMMVVTLVMSVVMLWFMPCPRVSMSLVMRLSTSPTVRSSKYFMGIC